MKSFNFDLSNKLNSNLSAEKIQTTLTTQVSNEEEIKEKLKGGGVIFIGNPRDKRVIHCSENFLTSKNEPRLKFINFINLADVPKTVKLTFDMILKDPSYFADNNEMVDFSMGNTQYLVKVLRKYDYNKQIHEETKSIFKVDGISYKDKATGKKSNPFRIYLSMEEENGEKIYNLIFCDIYHLCIPQREFNKLKPDAFRIQVMNKHRYTCHNHLRDLLT